MRVDKQMTTQIKVSLGWYERIWTLLEVYEMIDTNFILQTTLLLTCAKRWSCFKVIVHDSWINIKSQNNLSRYTYHLRSLLGYSIKWIIIHFGTDLWCCNISLYFNYILKIDLFSMTRIRKMSEIVVLIWCAIECCFRQKSRFLC